MKTEICFGKGKIGKKITESEKEKALSFQYLE